jgi:hypothetical protein
MATWTDTFDENTDWADDRADVGDGTPGVYRLFVQRVNRRMRALQLSPGIAYFVEDYSSNTGRGVQPLKTAPSFLPTGSSWAALQGMVWGIAPFFVEPQDYDGWAAATPFTPKRRPAYDGSHIPLTDCATPYPEIKFPGPDGFTRKRGRFITSTSMTGTDGQRAMFRAFASSWTDPWDGATVFPATPSDERGYSGLYFVYDGDAGEWVLSDDQDTEEDELTSHGLICEGDRMGPWILDELRDAINQLIWTFAGGEVANGAEREALTGNQHCGQPFNSFATGWKDCTEYAGDSDFPPDETTAAAADAHAEANYANAGGAYGYGYDFACSTPFAVAAVSSSPSIYGPTPPYGAELARAEATHYAYQLPATTYEGAASHAVLEFFELGLPMGGTEGEIFEQPEGQVFNNNGDPINLTTWTRNATATQAGITTVDGPRIGDAATMPARWPTLAAVSGGFGGWIGSEGYGGVGMRIVAKWETVFNAP